MLTDSLSDADRHGEDSRFQGKLELVDQENPTLRLRICLTPKAIRFNMPTGWDSCAMENRILILLALMSACGATTRQTRVGGLTISPSGEMRRSDFTCWW